METAFLGLGSNLGDRAGNLDRALAELVSLGVQVTALSSVYRTAPVGRLDQPEFLNQAAAVQTGLPPSGLLALCRGIEVRMGRQQVLRDGPRLIDLDLLLYGDCAVSTPELTVPHPRMHQRRFVLVPLCEIGSEVRHPLLRRTVRELLLELRSEEPEPEVLTSAARQIVDGRALPAAGVDHRRGLG